LNGRLPYTCNGPIKLKFDTADSYPKCLIAKKDVKKIKNPEYKTDDKVIVVDGVKYHNMTKIKKHIKDNFNGEANCLLVKTNEYNMHIYVNEDDYKELIDKMPCADEIYIKMKWLCLTLNDQTKKIESQFS
jgi:hypothetical protein